MHPLVCKASRADFGHFTSIRADAASVLVDHFLAGFGPALRIIHVPEEGLEERIDELAAQLRLGVTALAIGFSVPLERLDQSCDFRRQSHPIGLLLYPSVAARRQALSGYIGQTGGYR
jgi:hypothetical protein